LTGPADAVAREAAGFFYASFTLIDDAREAMLAKLATLLSKNSDTEAVTFAMPVNRLVVDLLDSSANR
jgi:hypothetical protein